MFFCAPSLSSFRQKEIQSIFHRENIPVDFSYNTNQYNKLDDDFNYNLNIKNFTQNKVAQKRKFIKTR